jgi:phosphoglycerate dehydrogenase-like enzyme
MEESILIVSFTFRQVDAAFAELRNAGYHPVVYPECNATRISADELSAFWASLPEQPVAIVMGADAPITEEFLCKARTLKAISLNCAGYDHVDLDACGRHGVSVSNVSQRNFDAVADFAFGQILCLMRNHCLGDRAIRAGRWCEGVQRSAAVSGKTLGIVGMGAIGQAIAKRAKGFDMRVVAKSTAKKPELARQFDLTYPDDETFFATSDIVVLCCPHNEKTHHMINEKTLGQMKSSAYLINPSRGGLIDTLALCQALQNGAIAGAALDAFEDEPLLESQLFLLNNVLLTPHIGGLADRQIDEVAMHAARNCVALLDGETVESKLV